MEGEVERLGARRIERGGEDGWRGRRRRPALLCSARLEDEGEGVGENGYGFVRDKDDARAWQARFADVRRVASPVLLPSARAYGVESTVNELNSFEMIF